MSSLSLAQRFGYVFGAVYLLVGAAGFVVTGDVDFAANQGEDLIVFEVNPLHNIVHLGVGALLVGAAFAGRLPARLISAVVGAVYLVVGIIGFFALDESWNLLAINQPDNLLHLGSAGLALAVAAIDWRSAPQNGAPGADRSVDDSRTGASEEPGDIHWHIGEQPGAGTYACTKPDCDWTVTLEDASQPLPPCGTCPAGAEIEYRRV